MHKWFAGSTDLVEVTIDTGKAHEMVVKGIIEAVTEEVFVLQVKLTDGFGSNLNITRQFVVPWSRVIYVSVL